MCMSYWSSDGCSSDLDGGVDTFEFHILEPAGNLANALALGIAKLLLAVLADAQAVDDLVLGAGDQKLAFLARMDRMILQRSGQAVEEEAGGFHDVAVGAANKIGRAPCGERVCQYV